MIEHTVSFRLNHPLASPQEADFLRAAAELAALPAVKEFQIRRQVSPKNPYTHNISMRFETQAQFQAYSAHPAHKAFVQERWLKEVADFQEADFEPLD